MKNMIEEVQEQDHPAYMEEAQESASDEMTLEEKSMWDGGEPSEVAKVEEQVAQDPDLREITEISEFDALLADPAVQADPELREMILQAEIDKLRVELAAEKVVPVAPPVTPAVTGLTKISGKKYVLLTKELANWGRVPQQQRDIAAILSAKMHVGTEYGEAEVFTMLNAEASKFPALQGKQSVEYVFRYYRGLKSDGKHGGYIARNFLRVV